MSVCAVTGKRTQKGNTVSHANNRTRRWLKVNIQKVRVILPSGEIKRVYVSVKAIRSGKIQKAPVRPKVAAQSE